MAARQDQTLQIVLVGTIFSVIVLFVLWYIYWKGYNETLATLTATKTQLNEANSKAGEAQAESVKLRTLMGFGESDNLADIEKAHEEDMKKFAQAMGADDLKSYRNVLVLTAKQLDDTTARETDLKTKVKEADDAKQAVEAAKETQLVKFQEELKKAQEDLAGERARFDKDRAGLETTKGQLQQKVDEQKTTYEGQLTDRATRIKELEDKVTKLEHAIANMIEERKDPGESFSVADGRISSVSQDGTVWINLGTADSLRRQVSFSVFDADQHDAEKATKKGSIEVTRLISDHMAEARITDDSSTNPILTGDLIYSQVWHRGKKLKFAFAGIIDVDGDGTADMKLARELVEMNGGVVDVYVGDDGKTVGTLSPNTRYLVLGKYPEGGPQAEQQKGWDDLTKEAKGFGVQTITLEEFLDRMGYKPEDRAVKLGAGATAGDFPARSGDGTASPPGNGFRPRSPYRPRMATPTPGKPFAPVESTTTPSAVPPTPY